jgi:predicted PurR-regulated permease PerM
MVPAVLVALTASGSAVIAVLAVYGIVQLLESYLITPLIEKNTVSIPLFPLVAAQLVMGSLLGIGGIMFATPLLLTLAVAVQIVYVNRILGEDVAFWGT